MLSVDSSVVSLSEIAGSGSTNITVQYTQGETTVTSEPVILEIVGISGVTMTVSAYPQQGATSSNDILIERFRETNVYQQLILSLTALLSNGTSVDVTDFTNFTTTSEHVYLTGNVVTATEQGTAVVTGTLGCLATADHDLTVQVLDQEVSVVAIPTLSLPLSHGTLSGFTNQSHHPNVSLLLSDGTEYPHFLTRSGPAVPGLLQFSVNTDAVVVDSQSGEVTLVKNSLYLTTLVASSGAVSSSISFQTDLLPSVGEVDVEGFNSNQTAGNFDVDIYLNAEGHAVSLTELVVHYDPVVLEPLTIPGSTLPDVVSGRDLPNCKLGVTSYKHRDFVRLGYVFPEPVLGSPRMHVATFHFELLLPTLTANFSFGVTAVRILSSSSATSVTASFPSPPSVFGTPSLDPAPLQVSQCPSPPCSTQQCSHMTMLLVPGDANGDCVHNLLDAYFTLQMLQQLYLSDEHGLSSDQLKAMDADFNGVINEADVRLLAEASLVLHPLVTELVVRPIDVEHSDCVLTILLTLKSQYGTDVDDTYVFFGIFHEDPFFGMQYDNTNLDIGMKVNTLTPPGVYGGWIEAANTGNGSFTLRTGIGPIAQTDIGLVVVYGTPTTSGVVLAERTLTLTGAPVVRPTYRGYSATFSPIVGRSFSLLFHDFEPLVRFNNSFSGLACMNNHPPVIDPRLQGRIVITQNETVSIGVIKMDRISVTDEDVGQSGSVRFSLENLSEPDTLSIDPLTGNIIVSESLDREAYESIRGDIVATDQGPQMFTRLSDSIAFELILQDINDNPPLTERAVYNVTVSEDIVVPSGGESVSVLNITGQDRDVSSANRGFSILRVTESYSTSPSQTFKLRAKEDGTNFTLSLHLTASLNHRVQDSYVLTILLVDDGHPNLNSSAVVNVEVTMSSSVPTPPDITTVHIVVIVAVCVLVLLFLLAVACLCYCRRSSRKRLTNTTIC